MIERSKIEGIRECERVAHTSGRDGYLWTLSRWGKSLRSTQLSGRKEQEENDDDDDDDEGEQDSLRWLMALTVQTHTMEREFYSSWKFSKKKKAKRENNFIFPARA
jgi:hypothetical protein